MSPFHASGLKSAFCEAHQAIYRTLNAWQVQLVTVISDVVCISHSPKV